MKSIKLHAYFANNLGDDLMVDILLKRYPQYKFWSDTRTESSRMFLEYPNFENRDPLCRKYGRINYLCNLLTFHRKEDFLLHRLFQRKNRKCCCSVYIGGSLFMQAPNETGPQRIAKESKKLDKTPLFIIGANFGPYHSSDFLESFTTYFRNCEGVTFRDQHSFVLFAQLPNVAMAPDVVLNLPRMQSSQAKQTVIISVIDMQRRVDLREKAEQYENFIREFCSACIDAGKTPVLTSFCEQEGDGIAIKRIWEQLACGIQKKTQIYTYKDNLQEAKELFAGANFVLATRFHAMILALVFGKPFFSISYNEKVKNVLDDLGSDAYCGLDEINTISAKELLCKYAVPTDITEYAHSACQQFEQFDRYMSHGEQHIT